MNARKRREIALALLPGLMLAGCVALGTRPFPEVEAVQAVQEIPEDERLDVVVRVFDPGIPASLAGNEQALAQKRIFPDIRRAEARYIAVTLRNTLEGTSQWGAVRVAPEDIQFVDVTVSGRIVKSTGTRLVLEVSAHDSTGRVWLDNRRYVSDADVGSYSTDAARKARDPFQNVYSAIANDLLAARGRLDAARLRKLRQVTELSFAADLAPEALSGYLRGDGSPRLPLLPRAAEPGPRPGGVRGEGSPRRALMRVVRLPARNDPVAQRVQRIREYDAQVIDTLDGYYTGFHEQMRQSYDDFRSTFHQIEKEERALRSGQSLAALGAAMPGTIPIPVGCGTTTGCRLDEAPRISPVSGDTDVILSNLRQRVGMFARAEAFARQIRSFRADADARVVDVEARSQELTSAAGEQYSEMRWLLREYQAEESAPARADETRP